MLITLSLLSSSVNYDVTTFNSKHHSLRKPRLANFVDIAIIENMFNKTAFKDSRKLRRLEIVH